MVSGDAPRSVRFYRDLLGIPLVKRTVNFDDPASYHLYFGAQGGAPGTLLTFFEWKGLRRGRWGVGGIHHVALGTRDGDTQLQWKRRLLDAGVAVSGPYDRKWFHSIYFADADGQILEIATAGPGYAVDEPADALGQRLVLPGEERIRGHRDEGAIASRVWPEPVPQITADMRLTGIHHITGITRDVERAGEFYEQTLGLRRVKQSVNQDDADTPHWFWASYDGRVVAPHSSLTMFGWPTASLLARPGVGQTHHIAFRAQSEDEQAAWRDHLLSLGVDVTPVLDRRYFKSIYFQAPDGLLMEVATDGPGFAVDEDGAALGRELKLPEWLEPEREQIARVLAALP
jgi:glyoxalase family protein